ncbi:putative protein [Abditibacteriota bacterium]|nr:putative protein [Abditibacteriota bacterium]
MVVLLLLEPSLLYHPRTDKQDWREFPSDFEELVLADGTGALWCPLEGSQLVVLYCHGNYGNLSRRVDWIVTIQRHLRASVLIFDPPGYGKTPGKPTEAGCYASAESAFVWLKERGIETKNIVLWGKSLGAGMATELALRHPDCHALVMLYPFSCVSDAANVMLHVPLGFLARNRFDNARKIGRVTMLKIIIGAEQDTLCPAWMAKKLIDLAPEPKAGQILRGRQHAEALSESEWAWLAAQLKG